MFSYFSILLNRLIHSPIQLDSAELAVTEELKRLDQLTGTACNSVNRLFEELAEVLEKKRLEMISDVRRRRTEKSQVLEQQLKQIQSQRSHLATDLSGAKSNNLDMKVRWRHPHYPHVKLIIIRMCRVRSVSSTPGWTVSGREGSNITRSHSHPFLANFPSRERTPTSNF